MLSVGNVRGSCLHRKLYSCGCKGVGQRRRSNSRRRPIGMSCLSSPGKRILARFINQMVASVYSLPASRLLRCDRGKASASRARQVSIYLMHTLLSLSYGEVGTVYGKDRTTIAYACHLIEDLRDEPAFDDKLLELENTIIMVLSLVRLNASRKDVCDAM